MAATQAEFAATRPEGPLHRTLRVDEGKVVWSGGGAVAESPVGTRDFAFDEAIYQLGHTIHQLDAVQPERDCTDPAAAASSRAERLHQAQRAAGEALARVFLSPAVAAAITADVALAESQNASLCVAIEVERGLGSLPWEALPIGEGGEPLALHPRVAAYRRVAGLGPTPDLNIPGPLRILVAIGSPEAQNARGELLDMEEELRRILDSVEPARRAGHEVRVRILENGSVAAIRATLEEDRYHVLHLSCHAGPGILLLENEDGENDWVDAERFWREALPPDRGVPLIFLAGCSTALEGDQELTGLSRGLLEKGCPAVIATRDTIGDAYAISFGAELYRALTVAPSPLRAITEARHVLKRRHQAGAAGRVLPEWSTPVIFLRGASEQAATLALFDPRAPSETLAEPVVPSLAAGVLVRRVGEFVGRRHDLRLVPRLLAEREMGGVLLRGLGGLGKSTLAAQLAHKLATEGFLVVSLFGVVDSDGILEEVGRALVGEAQAAGLPENDPLRTLAQTIQRRDLEVGERFEHLAERFLEHRPLLLLLDNFEDNLTPPSEGMPSFGSTQLAAFLAAWLERPGRSRLLVTCRYPLRLAGLAARRLRDHALRPLSWAETRKLLWRLPELDPLTHEEQQRIWLAVGGHPRALEYLDALLAGGKARFEDVAQRLEDSIAASGIEDPAAWLVGGQGAVDGALAELVTLAASDVLLDALLALVRAQPLAERLLLGAAVYRRTVPVAALVWQLGEIPALPRNPAPDPLPNVPPPPGWTEALAKLDHLGLLAPATTINQEPHVLVHRWTAAGVLEKATSVDRVEAHRRAASYWRWRAAEGVQNRENQTVDLLEALHHHQEAGERDEALRVAKWACAHLHDLGAYRQEEELIHEMLSWLPAGTEEAAGALGQLGNVAYQRGDFDQALYLFRQSLVIFQDTGNRVGMATSFHMVGMVAQQRGDFAQALDSYRKAVEIFEALGRPTMMARSFHQIGNIAFLRGDIDQALDCYRKSLETLEAIGDRAGMAIAYHQFGMVAQQRGDLDLAYKFYRDALEIDEELGNLAGIASTLPQLGIIAYRRGDLNQALDRYRRSLAIKESLGDRAGMANSLFQIGMVAQQGGAFDQALDFYRKSLDIAEALGNRAAGARARSQTGVLLTGRDAAAEALPWNLRSFATRLDLGVPELRIDLHWLRRQREMLGDERFRAIASELLETVQLTAVIEMLDQAED